MALAIALGAAAAGCAGGETVHAPAPTAVAPAAPTARLDPPAPKLARKPTVASLDQQTGRQASGQVDSEPIALPVDSPWDLPPIMQLRASGTAVAARPAELRRKVLHSPRLLLSPQARRNVARGRVDARALTLLLRRPRMGSPLLVFSARGRTVRVQETNLTLSRRTLRTLASLPSSARPAAVRFEPMSLDKVGSKQAPGVAIGERAAELVLLQLGVPYVWGGETPGGGFDCSGLMMYVYHQLGVGIHHWTGFQYHEGRRILSQDLRAGDLVFFRLQGGVPGHVGMYIGNGQFVHAPRTGDVVRVAELLNPRYAGSYAGAVRPYE